MQSDESAWSAAGLSDPGPPTCPRDLGSACSRVLVAAPQSICWHWSNRYWRPHLVDSMLTTVSHPEAPLRHSRCSSVRQRGDRELSGVAAAGVPFDLADGQPLGRSVKEMMAVPTGFRPRARIRMQEPRLWREPTRPTERRQYGCQQVRNYSCTPKPRRSTHCSDCRLSTPVARVLIPGHGRTTAGRGPRADTSTEAGQSEPTRAPTDPHLPLKVTSQSDDSASR